MHAIRKSVALPGLLKCECIFTMKVHLKLVSHSKREHEMTAVCFP